MYLKKTTLEDKNTDLAGISSFQLRDTYHVYINLDNYNIIEDAGYDYIINKDTGITNVIFHRHFMWYTMLYNSPSFTDLINKLKQEILFTNNREQYHDLSIGFGNISNTSVFFRINYFRL